MRHSCFTIFVLLLTVSSLAQPAVNTIYKRIVDYYKNNPGRIEFVYRTNKNALKYDTITSHFCYVPLDAGGYFIFQGDSAHIIRNGMLYSNNHYLLRSDRPEKILVRKKELKGTIHSRLRHIPVHTSNSSLGLTFRYGPAVSITPEGDRFIIKTTKATLETDTSNFRILGITEIFPYKKELVQYDRYDYVQLPDSVASEIKKEVHTLTEASKNFPVTTLTEIRKRRPAPENVEGTPFAFSNLVAFNAGHLDEQMKNKFVIIDFFYQACLPCHKMTGYLLDWLPKIDTSKIMLIGVNPADTEESMKTYAVKRRINYPVIVGPQAKTIAKKYVSEGYPTLLLLSPDGTILIKQNGMSKSFLNRAEKLISK